jgi:hypothetical protein
MSQTPGKGSALPLPNTHATGGRGALSGEQHKVYDILAKMKPEIARMYEACLLVLGCVEHDERLPLAAHAAREIFRHMPELFDLAWDRRRLKNELQNLKAKYQAWHPGFPQGGEMPEANPHQDARLRKFLRYYEFIATYDGGSRKDQAARLFGLLIPGINTALLQDFARKWVGLYGYFEDVAHHGSTTTKEDFNAHLTEFQGYILRTQELPAIADLDAIDELITEVQANGPS